MMNSIALLDHANKKIVVLRSVEFRTEPANFPDNLTTHCGKMTDVIVREEKIGRPIRFKRRRVAAILGQFVLVRVNQIGVGMGLQKLRNLEKRVRFQDVVMIEKRDPIALSQFEALILRRRNPFVLPNSRKSYALVACSQCRQHA